MSGIAKVTDKTRGHTELGHSDPTHTSSKMPLRDFINDLSRRTNMPARKKATSEGKTSTTTSSIEGKVGSKRVVDPVAAAAQRARAAKATQRNKMEVEYQMENDVSTSKGKLKVKVAVAMPPSSMSACDARKELQKKRRAFGDMGNNKTSKTTELDAKYDPKRQKVASSTSTFKPKPKPFESKKDSNAVKPVAEVKPIAEVKPVEKKAQKENVDPQSTLVRHKKRIRPAMPAIPIPEPLAPHLQEANWDFSNLSIAIDNLLSELPDGVTDVDAEEKDHFNCPEYANDVIAYLQAQERNYLLNAKFLEKDAEVSPHMRAILADWLVQVQDHLNLMQCTLHLTATMIDQFIVRQKLALNKLQLLGVTCLLIASKFEERFNPSIEKLIHLTDNTYTFDEVISMEMLVLKTLNYQIHLPVPVIFLDRYLKIAGSHKKLDVLCRYMLDLSLPDIQMVQFSPSMRAAAVVCLAQKILLSVEAIPEALNDEVTGPKDCWTRTLQHYSTYSEAELMPCMQRYCRLLLRAEKSKYQGAREKYASNHTFGAISLWPVLTKSSIVQEIALHE